VRLCSCNDGIATDKSSSAQNRWTMIDHEWNAEDKAITEKARHVPRFGLPARLGASLVAACVLLLALYPWGADSFYPEGNWLPGPLWLFRTQSAVDKTTGAIASTVLMPVIFAFLIKPGRLTAVLSITGILAWVGFGMWLAMMAAC
jgi:hypothetical protein